MTETNGRDWTDNPEWREYADRFRDDVLPKLGDSSVFLSIMGPELDVKQATELGAMLILDKPLVLVIPRGRTVGTRLRRAADAVIEDWDLEDPDAREQLANVLQALAAEAL